MNLFSANLFEEIADEFGVVGADAFFQEMKKGEELRRGTTEKYLNSMASVHHRSSGAVGAMGYVSDEIPGDVWHDWNRAYPGFWNDSNNRRWFLNQFPQCRVKYQGKIRVAWQPTLDRTNSGLFIGQKYGRAA